MASLGDDDFSIDVEVVERLSADFDLTLKEMAQAAMAAADAVEASGKRELRADVRQALGDRVANAWRSRVWPNRGGQASITPSIGWWSNAPHIVRAFAEGVTMRAGEGKYLLIPTENAPQSGLGFGQSGRLRRARNYALVAAEKRFGKLRYIKVKGRDLILLVADKVQKNKSGYAKASKATLRRRRQENGVVMFVLVPEATMPKIVDPNAIEESIGRDGIEQFTRAYREVLHRYYGHAQKESP